MPEVFDFWKRFSPKDLNFSNGEQKNTTRFHWIRSPPLSSLSQVCPLTVTASRLVSVTPQLLCLDFLRLRLSQSLSVVPPTSSRCLHLSIHLITLSLPFHRVAHAVAAFPLTLFLPLLRLPISTSSDFLSPYLTNTLQHFLLLSLSTSALLLPKRIYCTKLPRT